jgi:glycosyltransferase involved in cell wall biosynthesis
MTQGLVSIVVPLFNEEENVIALIDRLESLARLDLARWEFVLVNDGSSDRTRERVLAEVKRLPLWKFIELSRNFGQQAAYRAGLHATKGDAVVFLDADLQDPPELIPEMIRRWQEGAKLVTACRRSRSEKGVRRLLFDAFHAIFFRVTHGLMPKDSGTFGLMDRVIVDELRRMPELSVFLPALRSWVGFRQEVIWYDRAVREGASKQSMSKLFGYAWSGITSFSTVPLKLISLLGLVISTIGFAYAAGLLCVRILQWWGWFPSLVVQGFTSLAVAILCLGGIQLLCLGVIGEYLEKVYTEVKRRPPYIVAETLQSDTPHEP